MARPVGHLAAAVQRAVVADRTAPAVTFGAIGGAEAGALLQVAYVSDEPLARAVLHATGRQLELGVLADRLEVALPPDWPAGPADIEVFDAAGNARRYPAVLAIVAPVGRPVRGRGGGGGSTFSAPPRRRRVEHRTAVSRSTLRLRSGSGVATRTASSGAVRTTSRAQVATAVVSADRAAVSSRSAARAAVDAPSTLAVSTIATLRRRDGRALEEALLLELLG